MDLLRHLKFFVTIVEEGHFGRAAARLGMAQPPLLQGVKRLESALGVTLMTRNARGVRLTAAGADLLPAVRAMLEQARALHDRAGELAGQHGTLRLGVVPQVRPTVTAGRSRAAMTITQSDNTAADVVLARVGLDRVHAALGAFGLPATTVVGGTGDVQRRLTEQTGTPDVAAAFAALASNDEVADVAAYDPALTSATTARDMTRLLELLWTDAAASPVQCRFARELLAQQVWPHRLRAGFPYRGVRVAGKTGTIGAVRNEVGVVTFDGELPVAVAVFTHAARADPVLPRADAVIGETARLAVTELRSGRL